MKVVLTPGNGALRRRLVDCLLAAGHDARPLEYAGGLPPGPDLRDALAGAGAVMHGAGGLLGPSDVDLADTRRVAKAAAATGTHLVLVVPGPVAAVEAVVESVVGDAWTLQPATSLAGDVAAWLESLRVGPVVPVPRGLVLQPVDPGEVADRLVHLLRAGPAGRVPVFGGPAVRPVADLARSWLRSGRRRALVVPTSRVADPPGAVTFPDRAVGHVTWEDWLAADDDVRQPRTSGSAGGGGDRREEAVGAE